MDLSFSRYLICRHVNLRTPAYKGHQQTSDPEELSAVFLSERSLIVLSLTNLRNLKSSVNACIKKGFRK